MWYEFFSSDPGRQFLTFSVLHFFIIAFTTMACAIIIFFRKALQELPINNILPKVFAAILFINMAVFYIGYLLTGSYDITLHLPLQFCYVTGYLFIYMLWFNKPKMYNFLFYSIFMCTLVTLIWAPPLNSFDRIQFYQFWISHSGLLIMNFYAFYVLNLPVNKKGVLWALIYSVGLFIFASIFNRIFGTNYIFSEEIPEYLLELYPFLDHISYPIILLALGWIGSVAIAYLLVRLKAKSDK